MRAVYIHKTMLSRELLHQSHQPIRITAYNIYIFKTKFKRLTITMTQLSLFGEITFRQICWLSGSPSVCLCVSLCADSSPNHATQHDEIRHANVAADSEDTTKSPAKSADPFSRNRRKTVSSADFHLPAWPNGHADGPQTQPGFPARVRSPVGSIFFFFFFPSK